MKIKAKISPLPLPVCSYPTHRCCLGIGFQPQGSRSRPDTRVAPRAEDAATIPRPPCKIKTSPRLYHRPQRELLAAGPRLQPQPCPHLCHQGCKAGRPRRQVHAHGGLRSCSLTTQRDGTRSASPNLHELGNLQPLLKDLSSYARTPVCRFPVI